MRVRTTLLGVSSRVGVAAAGGGCVLLLGPKLLDALAYRGAAVEEVQGDTGGLGQAAEGDRLVAADDLAQSLLGSGLSGGALAGGGLAEVVRVAPHQLLSSFPVMASVRAVDAGAAYRLDGAVGEPSVPEGEDDPAEGVVFLAASGQPDVVLAHRLSGAGLERRAAFVMSWLVRASWVCSSGRKVASVANLSQVRQALPLPQT